ncbi:MAG TPA: glycosyltransferase [Candidatus Hydrogenedentes bacterium]|nr:glycosyltransferase [Candidatus Hydrogenedentota bacterium]
MQTNTTETESAKVEEYIGPVRGIISTHDHRGRPFDLTDLKKWILLNKNYFKAEKIDVRVVKEGLRLMPELLAHARIEKIPLSLRTDCEAGPDQLPTLAQGGLLDVFICPPVFSWEKAGPWICACEEAGLPIRVQLQPPFEQREDLEGLAGMLSPASSVNVALYDPFLPQPVYTVRPEEILRSMNGLVRALDSLNIEANLLHVPFCLAEEANRPHVVNEQQFFLDHQHYLRTAYTFAENLHHRGPKRLGKAVENLLARHTSLHNAIDNSLFPWLINHPLIYIRVWMLHKFTRHLFFLRSPKPLPENVSEFEAEVERMKRKKQKELGPACVACRFKRICGHATEEMKRCLPGIPVRAVAGEEIVSPRALAAQRKRYYDAPDQKRLEQPGRLQELAETARQIILHDPPTREISPDDYEIEKHYTHHMPGAVRWLSFVNAEHQSTVLARLEPPFTMGLTFGGGIASHIGFSFGRHARIICPMTGYSHRITLHVDKDGRYVLLRDGVLVRPTEFAGQRRLPPLLAGCLEPRISIHNIDGMILTQTLLLWEGERPVHHPLEEIKYSVIIVSTRYSRRLQATLMALAHQEDINPNCLEVVIGYVPGIDTTDDLIDSMRRAHPRLRIVRAPFSEDYVRAKGFMINESFHASSGKWIVLLDADIILPPDFFATLDKHTEGAYFVAPDGRRMLTPETTARILLGDIRPWENYEALALSEGEYRFREANRTPIGFCQCVRREVLEKNPYHELDHFESSDWFFGWETIKRFGKERRMEGMVVLHLDHGGSQWYGAAKHM